MLTQTSIRRRDSQTWRRGERETRGRGDGETRGLGAHQDLNSASASHRLCSSPSPVPRLPVSRRLRVVIFLAVVAASLACGSKPTDPRTVIPADAVIYLESADLGRTLETITGNAKFQKVAKSKPDLSALRGVRLSVAVLGFEATEEPVNEDTADIELQPKLVAVAETNAWGWQARSFVEEQLGEFVNELYNGTVEVEITTRNDGEHYVWTSGDGRKAYALQQGSLVYFSNDGTAIDRCLAVKRGEIPAIAGSSRIAEGEWLAAGHVSEDGVGQLGNIVGMQMAKSSGENADVQSFVATVLPQILRNAVREVSWTAAASDDVIEDRVTIKLDNESSVVFNGTLVPSASRDPDLSAFIPENASGATRYLLRDPQIAWRSVTLTAGKKTDATSGTLIVEFSGSLFEPYGIEDPEAFLSSTQSPILTVETSPDGEDAVVIAAVKDPARVRSSIAKEVNLAKPPERQLGADLWRSEDGEIAVAFIGDVVVSGDRESVLKCLEARAARGDVPAADDWSRQFAASDAVAVTVASEYATLGRLADVISDRAETSDPVRSLSRTETRFNQNGIERRSFSDFGLLGMIIAQLAQERGQEASTQ